MPVSYKCPEHIKYQRKTLPQKLYDFFDIPKELQEHKDQKKGKQK